MPPPTPHQLALSAPRIPSQHNGTSRIPQPTYPRPPSSSLPPPHLLAPTFRLPHVPARHCFHQGPRTARSRQGYFDCLPSSPLSSSVWPTMQTPTTTYFSLYPEELVPLITRADALLTAGQFGEAAKAYSEAIGMCAVSFITVSIGQYPMSQPVPMPPASPAAALRLRRVTYVPPLVLHACYCCAAA